MQKWDEKFEQAAFSAEDYRQFLSLFFIKKPAWKSPRPLTFQKFAERAGFSSKSFLNEVISGRRKISARSLEKVLVGLNLSRDWQDYFRLLVSLSEPEFQTPGLELESVRQQLLNVKKRLVRVGQSISTSPQSMLSKVALEPHCTDICVAVGDPQKGATIEQIQSLTRLTKAVLSPCLKKMVKVGLIRFDTNTNRYHNLSEALNSKHGNLDQGYQDYFWSRMVRSQQRMKRHVVGVFMTQTFTVKQSSLPGLVQELERLIIQFADQADQSDGDGIAEVLVTLNHNFDDI